MALKSIYLFAIGLALALSVGQAGATEDDLSSEDLKEMAGFFIRCAGTYTWAAQVTAEAGKPATTEHLKGLARGAKTAAAWAMAARQNQNHPGDQQPVGSWFGYVEPQIEIAANRMKALSEMDDQEAINQEMEFCTTLDPLQASIIDHIRESRAK